MQPGATVKLSTSPSMRPPSFRRRCSVLMLLRSLTSLYCKRRCIKRTGAKRAWQRQTTGQLRAPLSTHPHIQRAMQLSTSFALLAAFVPYALAQQAPEWGQCGGIGFTGPTTCVAGTVCTVQNAYYSQCLPGSVSSVLTTMISILTFQIGSMFVRRPLPPLPPAPRRQPRRARRAGRRRPALV